MSVEERVVHAPETAPIPPQNLEAEESVLGAVMLAPGVIDAVRAVLSPAGGEFYRESHARIWRAALQLADAGDPVDVITVTDRLDETGELDAAGGRGRVYELAALVPATTNAAHYAGLVTEAARLRNLIRVGGEIARLGWERPGDIDDIEEQARVHVASLDRPGGSPLALQTWRQFERDAATEHVPTIVAGLWPEGALGFVAAPPKKGKTWVGLSLAIAVATGKPFLGRFDIPKPQPVVVLALEGHKAAIRGRIGCLARGLGEDPDSGALDNLHVLYKPRGLNLSDPAWVRTVRDTITNAGAQLLVVDVLRRAAILKENSNDDFAVFLHQLDPIAATGCSIALLHHFGKLTEISRDRTPGERMSGAGAMYGAFDVGVFITGSDDGSRRLRVDFETRDLADPDTLGIYLTGNPTGINGGFIYNDAAHWEVQERPPDESTLKVTSEQIAEYVRTNGGDVLAIDVRRYFSIDAKTLDARVSMLWMSHQIEYVGGRGRPGKLVDRRLPDDPQMRFVTDAEVPESEFGNHESGFRNSRTQPLNHAGLTPVPESSGIRALPNSETADLQEESSSGVPPSPTERNAPADASRPLRDDRDREEPDPWDLTE